MHNCKCGVNDYHKQRDRTKANVPKNNIVRVFKKCNVHKSKKKKGR